MDPIPLYELVAVSIITLTVAALAMWGLWSLWRGPQDEQPPPRQNRKLTHAERLVRTGSVKRVL